MNPFNLTVTFADGKPINEARLIGEADKSAYRSLMRLGAFIRRRAQTSLKYVKKQSTPGNPPRVIRANKFVRTSVNRRTGVSKSRATSPLRELIAFAVTQDEAGNFKLVVGPMLFRKTRIGNGGEIPRLLEQGGSGVFASGKRVLVGTYEARPFMGPAFRAELPQVPKLFTGLIQGKAR